MEFPSFPSFAFLCIFIFIVIRSCVAQPTTDPSEVIALNSIFRQWGTSASNSNAAWNISGEPCSGAVMNGTEFESPPFNPAIQCDCTYNDNTTCHITRLRVYALQVSGVIPKELANLTYLTFLKIDQNYLTGPLPPFIGDMANLELLSIAINGFTGPIPKELGKLRKLYMLSFGSNSFSGTLPAELGSLVNLEQIYMASSGLSGEIPSTFANLVKMQTMWASDNSFTGKIPDFIGNWTKLKALRFQGNSFEGPIPPSFSQLLSMEDLRISDLANVSSSLSFLGDLKNLSALILRNNLISGNIPSNIGEYQGLNTLDFSFNNLTGRIPSSIFNLSSLVSLFLGNNSLSGTIPSRKLENIVTVDLSYNRLSGRLPSWATQENLQLNVVVNNLTFSSSSDNRASASRLDCLQREFPCNRGTPRYSSFALNCGGPQISNDRALFEAENSTFSPASYFVTSSLRWAVSNVGVFSDSSAPSYVANTLAQTTNTLDSELFQTARLSPGSLRYYGLGLQNGIYNVNLQFAEIGLDAASSRRWQSFGRRIFDIYLQGSLQVKDFDIRREAGGAINRAVVRNFNVQVSENFLEIHLFWAGKGTCCIPTQGYYGPLISAINVTPRFRPNVTNLPPSMNSPKNRTGMIIGIIVALAVVSIVCAFIIFYLRRKRSSRFEEEEDFGIENMPNTFSYAELRTATEDFSPENKLGEGGFGPVYKGTLSDGKEIAVKKLLTTSNQGKSQFVAEISIISAVQHRNLVKLYGCCIEGANRLLVYEYLENKSLDQALFGNEKLCLDWKTRFNICLGAARGLTYLHEDSKPRIVHRDVKASNILLDLDLIPKISDFGLAKLYDDKKTHISTRVAGTIGYLAPEYAMRGHLTEKADVFGFGVVALEILCGRPNTDSNLEPERIYLLEWAWNLYESNRGLELLDPTLTEFNKEEAIRLLGVSLLCTQASPLMRPPMSRVVAMLSGDIDVSPVTQKPSYLTDWQVSDMTSFISEEGTSGSSTSRAHTGQPYSETSTGMAEDQSPLPMLRAVGSIGR
ncbi:hypothetical protein ACHQM5_004172 [Ranunculus cassubicifolius]